MQLLSFLMLMLATMNDGAMSPSCLGLGTPACEHRSLPFLSGRHVRRHARDTRKEDRQAHDEESR